MIKSSTSKNKALLIRSALQRKHSQELCSHSEGTAEHRALQFGVHLLSEGSTPEHGTSDLEHTAQGSTPKHITLYLEHTVEESTPEHMTSEMDHTV